MRVSIIGVLSALAVLGLWINVTWATDTLTGTVTYIRDGDTIQIGGIAVRLQGVNAPERDEPLERKARQYLKTLLLGKTVRCELNGRQSHDRQIGICYITGRDIGAMVVAAGLALDCPRYSGGRYRHLEHPAAQQTIKVPGYC